MTDPTLPDGVAVRRAERADLPGLQETMARSWARAYDGILDGERLREATADPGTFYPPERFEQKLSAGTRRCFVATVEGTPRGAVNVAWSPETTHEFVPGGDGQVRGLYLHPDHWNRGIGTALVEQAVASLPGDVGTVWVEALADNEVGTGFYESVGFDPVDGREIDLMGGTHPTTIFRRDR